MIQRDERWREVSRYGVSWATLERQRAKVAQTEARRQAEERLASVQVADLAAERAAMPVPLDATEAEIRDLAERRAALMMDRIAEAAGQVMPPCVLLKWLNAEVQAMQGGVLRRSTAISDDEQRRGLIGRATCPRWWRKALRKAQTNAREAAGRKNAEVCAQRQPYVTNDTMRRRMARDAANAEMMAGVQLENEDGQVYTLAELAERSTSNPAIRRGELMTRIRGCEEWAAGHGMVGMFTTQTTPSRFHAAHRHGGVNAKWIEAGRPTPKDGQQWLCKAWARARAELARRGLGLYGMRVAEPHHDGTPHWHGLFFVKPEQFARVAAVIRRHWLKDAGTEPGAKAHRFKVLRMEHGGAAGYIAKYIAKGIDDEGAVGLEGHDDEVEGRTVRMQQADLFGGGAQRVAAWARAHGIRQFQAIGQPPVTVWRELRRISPEQARNASERVQAAWAAAQREGEQRASWSVYMVRQGGPMVGRDYRIGMETEQRQVQGVYEVCEKPAPVGVVDRLQGAKAYSSRKEWRPRGGWKGANADRSGVGLLGTRRALVGVAGAGHRRLQAVVGAQRTVAPALAPWTRVNNCTWEGGARPLVMDWRDAFPPELVAEIEARRRAVECHTLRKGVGDGET